jgi:hypothetical protein
MGSKKIIMNYRTFASSALLAFSALTGSQVLADQMASIAITPATGVVTLAPHWAVSPNLAGFHFMSQDLNLGGGATQFYSIKAGAIPEGGDVSAFTLYIAASGASTAHEDIGSKLTPNSYSALTSADPDVGYGSVQLYFIHHKSDGDYFSHIVPSSDTASAVSDLRPMSRAGGPATGGDSGYFGLTFSGDNLGQGANMFYYLRDDAVTGTTRFGSLDPALAGSSTDLFDLGLGGHNALAYTTTDVGYNVNQMYFLRLDTVTGFTVLGTLNPVSGKASDIANLGSVYSSLTFTADDVGFGTGRFYATGLINEDAQTVSFAAIEDRDTVDGSFMVNPTASSGLAIALTVVPGSVGSASVSAPVGGVYTVTPTAPGLITLQATQIGQLEPTVYAANMLRQSFTITGTSLLAITTHPTDQSKVAGTTATFTVVAEGTPELAYQWRKNGDDILDNVSATTATLTLTNVQLADVADYDVVVSNASGNIPSESAALEVTPALPDPVPPVITPSNSSAAVSLHTAFEYLIVASGSPTSYNASPLPAGLVIDTANGAISGIPTTSGTTVVTLSATNADGTDTAVLTLTVNASTHVTVAGALVTPISLSEDGLPPPAHVVYYATGLPRGLVLNPRTGQITSLPDTTVTARPGSYRVTYGTITTAENGRKTRSAPKTLTIVIDPLPTALSGGFEAILELPPLPGAPVGKVALLVNAKTGAFTGRLIMAKSYAFRGTLVLDSTYQIGSANVLIKRGARLSPYRLDITLNATLPAANVFAVSLRQLNAEHAVIATLGRSDSGVQLATYTRAVPTPWQGSYTMLLNESTNLGATASPEGVGHGLIKINAGRGTLVFKGKLGDGRKLSASLAPSADGSYRWYVSPYRTGGYFGGWIQFSPISGDTAPYQMTGTGDSELYWEKSAHSKDTSYRAGFGPVVLTANTQKWTAPAKGTSLTAALSLEDNIVESSFVSTHVPNADEPLLPTVLGLTVKNRFEVLDPIADPSASPTKARAFTGAVSASNGLFTGSLTLQDARRVTVNGVLQQSPSVVSGSVIGEGFFLIPPTTRGAESVYGKVQFLAP